MTSHNTIIADMQAEIAALKQDRYELLSALKLIYSWANNWDSEFMNDPDWKKIDYPMIQDLVRRIEG